METLSPEKVLSKRHVDIIVKKKELSGLLEIFDRGEDRSLAMQQRLQALACELSKSISKIDSLFQDGNHKLSKTAHNVWKRRIDHLQTELDSIQATLNSKLEFYPLHLESQYRKNLYRTNPKKDTSILRTAEQAFRREKNILTETALLLDSVTQQGRSTLTKLIGQSSTLKGAQKRLLDMRNSMQFSKSLMNRIKIRHKEDAYLVYGCMLLTLLIFVVLYYWTVYAWRKRL